MYYVIYVGSGNETRAEELIRHVVPQTCYEDCFHPVEHLCKKIHGEDRHIYRRMVPGYIFVKSNDIRSFYQILRSIPLFLHLLGKEEQDEEIDFCPLAEKESLWLEKLMELPEEPGSGERIIELSQVGFDENDQVVILSGPLKDMEGQIKKINLHQRIALVQFHLKDSSIEIRLGIEIMQKNETDKNIERKRNAEM